MASLRTNVAALNAQRLVEINAVDLARTSERLASGLRINRAADDPSGLGIAESLTAQIRGDIAAASNIQHATSALQIADTGLGQISDVLLRMRDLAIEANNTALTTDESAELNTEYQALQTTIDQIATSATFNGAVLLNGSYPNGALTIQTGAQSSLSTSVNFAGDFTANGLALVGTDVLNPAGGDPVTAQTAVDAARLTVLNARATFGAKQQSLDSLRSTLDAADVANRDARSKIQDADIAAETSRLVRDQLLLQSGSSALSSANLAPSFLATLLSR